MDTIKLYKGAIKNTERLNWKRPIKSIRLIRATARTLKAFGYLNPNIRGNK